MGLVTETTQLNDIDKSIGEVQANPTALTVQDRLKTIASNITSNASNFSALNSTNVNASKIDLDNALLAYGDPVNSPAVYSMNWRMWQVAVTIQSMGQNWFSTTNSSNLDLMKVALDNIKTNSDININRLFNVQKSTIRPANVTAYTANQMLSASTSVNNTITVDFSAYPNSANRTIQIDEILMQNNGTSGTLATLNLFLNENAGASNAWNGKDATTPQFNLVSSIGAMEVVNMPIFVKIPGDANNWNISKTPITGLNLKMTTDASSLLYICYVTTTAYTPVSNETFNWRFKGRFL